MAVCFSFFGVGVDCWFQHCLVCDAYAGVTTLAGGLSGTAGSFVDAVGTKAAFNFPSSAVLDLSGNLVISDSGNNRLRLLSPSGGMLLVSFFLCVRFVAFVLIWTIHSFLVCSCASMAVVTTWLNGGAGSFADGIGSQIQFNGPQGVTFDAFGNLLFVDRANNRIRRVTPIGCTA